MRSRGLKTVLLVLSMFYVLPLVASGTRVAMSGALAANWWEASRAPTGLSPAPRETREAVVQVFAAPAFNWRGTFGVHTWIALKPEGADAYTRYEVLGWGVSRGRDAIRAGNGNPDTLWFDRVPDVLVDLRGARAEAAIDEIEAAVADYPFNGRYTIWPGPNSNSFTAYVARRSPSLGLDLPANAIGKDYLAEGYLAPAPSNTGWQISLNGLLGVTLALEEGIEVNLLGLGAGVDFSPPALRLPGIGRFGF